MLNRALKLELAGRLPFLLRLRRPREVRLNTSDSYALLYHGFSGERRFRQNFTSLNKFSADLDALAKYFRFSGPASPAAKAPAPSSPAIFLSFDDGYRSVLGALEILEKRKISSVLYLNAACLEQQVLPKDQLWIALLNFPRGERLEVAGFSLQLRSADPFYRDYLAQTLNRQLSASLSLSNYREACAALYEKSRRFWKREFDELSLLRSEELADFSRRFPSCELGYHGEYHFPLPRLERTELEADFARGKNALESRLGRKLSHYSYPYGIYEPRHAEVARNHGFQSAVTTAERALEAATLTGFELPRICVDARPVVIDEQPGQTGRGP